MSVSVWRIALDTREYGADDLSGRGAERTGGRWNDKGAPLLYASSSRALACLETMVHLNAGGLPLNRYLVEIIIPDALWSAAQTLTERTAPVGWDAEPASRTSADVGNAWIRKNAALVLIVPSVVVPEEANILLNPRHADIGKVRAKKIRKWLYDLRLVR